MWASVRMEGDLLKSPTVVPSSAASLGDDRLCLQIRKLERVIRLHEFPSADAQSCFSYLLLLPALKKAVDETFSSVFCWELVTPTNFCRGPLNSYHVITALGSS